MGKLYAAYGSNMNLKHMSNRCPDAVKKGTGFLLGQTMTFRRGVANVEPAEDQKVPVVVWEITERCERALDAYEAYPQLYTKKELDVELSDDSTQRIMVYVMNELYWNIPAMPSKSYYQSIRQGYLDNGFDPVFLDWCVEKTKVEQKKK